MKKFYSIIIVCILLFSYQLNAQTKDTISGNFLDLKITNGTHIINAPVKVNGNLEISPGATIELSDPGVLVCYGDVILNGISKNKINILGNSKFPGMGIIVKSEISNNTQNLISINNTVFKNLQLPLFFDFGWERSSVIINNNFFINNTGNISTIQVLNPPFNLYNDTLFTEFKIFNNLFSGNNGSIYFEDFCSDYIKIDINNNTFYDNHIYGINNYNISSNFLNGRMDQNLARFTPTISNNNFIYNNLFDINTGTFVHFANFGIYGTNKSINLKNNYWGTTDINHIYKSIYDQKINYSAPEVEINPFLAEPNRLSPVHIYSINDLQNINISDTIKITKPYKGFIFKSNNKIDYTNSLFKYSYFVDDSSLIAKDSTFGDYIYLNDLETKFTLNDNLNQKNNVGYYLLTNLKNENGDYVPDVKIGYISYLNDLRRRTIISDLNKLKYTEDSLKHFPTQADSIKNTFQKIEAPLKSRIEIGLSTGASIFLGTISNKGNLFANDMNMLFGLNFNYNLYSNLSVGVNIEKFKLSNSDSKSNNNEQIARGMSFSTSMLSISPMLNYDFIDNRLYTKARRLRPSLGFGLDFVSFNPTGLYKGVVYDLQPLGTGGQYSNVIIKPYSLLTLGYFLNFKLKYQINRDNYFGVQFSFHRSISNYLDDVGADSYPTVESILNSKVAYKDAAIYFSNPTSRNVIGQFRNSPDNATDNYLNFGIFYSRKLFK